jgi:hypothetical protein
MNDEWQAVEIGASNLASELGHFEKELYGTQEDVQRVILRIFQLRSDFLVVASMGKRLESGNIFPLQSAKMYLALGCILRWGQRRGLPIPSL